MEYDGIVSLACLPYTSGNGTTGLCPLHCTDGEAYKKYHVKLLSTKTFSNPKSIQIELLANGPVETAFSVYEDFMNYKGGVYVHKSG